MKTTTQKTTRKKLLQVFLLAIGICFINPTWAAIKASFTYTTGANGQITCTSTSTGTTASTVYSWYPGDGSNGSTGKGMTTFNYAYSYNGSYYVTLYIQDTANTQFDSTSALVSISNAATCNLHADPRFTMGSAGLVNFSSSTSTGVAAGATYQWWFGDGYSSTSPNPSDTYVNNGTYYASLTITNGYGCTSTNYDTVVVTTGTGITPCTIQANFTYTVGVNGHVSFTSTTTGINSYVSYTWDPGDGTGNTNYGSTTYNHVYTANGSYTARLIAYADSSTCISTDTTVITVSNITTPCTLSANFTSTVNASGQVSFTSTSTGTNANTMYYWNPGDGTPEVLAGPTYSHTYVYQGNYYPWLVIKDTGSAYCVDSIYQQVSEFTADSNECHLKAHFTYSVGLNGHVSFTNTSTTINTFLNSYWNFGDGGTDFTGNNTDSHIYTANGTYTVTLTASADSALCLDSVTQVLNITNVTVPCTLSASFTSSNDTTKGMVYLNSTSTGTYAGTQYFWRSADSNSTLLGTGSSVNLTYPSNGTYTVWLIVENTGSAYCIDSVQETVNISNQDSLHASFISTNIGDTAGAYLYIFNSTSTGVNGVTEYRWDAGDTTGADSGIGMTSYSHYYKYSGTHIATLSIWFTQYPGMPHHSATGINDRYDFSTFSMAIDVDPQGIATITNPNADLKLYPNPNNGVFKLAISGIDNMQNAELQITNLMGQVVYQTTADSSNGMIQQDINLQNISSGTYFVRIITPGKVYNTKTVITK